jgi:hypothetical protein
MQEDSSDEIHQEEPKVPLWVALSIERAWLREAGMYGESDPFWRELLGGDVCDYWND